jgi:hypothetical protein
MFEVNKTYTRKDIYEILDIPKNKRGGDWQNGYHREGNDYFIFCNIGIAGRTGHDYDNHFEGDTLVWYGKTPSHFGHQTIQNMLSEDYRKLIFYRMNHKSAFTYAGAGVPKPHYEIERPVRIDWVFNDSYHPHIPSNNRKRAALDQETKEKIEQAAIKYIWSYYEGNGYTITDRQKDNCGYDLLASKEGSDLHLEVKGTALKKKRFYISRNERNNSIHPNWRLALVIDVFGEPKMSLYTKDELESLFQMDALSWECNER